MSFAPLPPHPPLHTKTHYFSVVSIFDLSFVPVFSWSFSLCVIVS